MKYLILVVFVLLVGCRENSNVVAEFKKEPLTYNPKTDSLINYYLDNVNPNVIEKEERTSIQPATTYKIYFNEFYLGIKHKKYKEYSQKEGWEFGGVYKDGTIMMLESNANLPEHKLRPETYQKIINYVQK